MILLVVVLLVLLVLLPVVGWALWLLLSAVLIGAIIGGLARLVLPGRQELGILSTVLIGWIGSLIGSLVGRHLFHFGTLVTVLCEIGVAAVLVAVACGETGGRIARRSNTLRW